jgi:hypothetical protein
MSPTSFLPGQVTALAAGDAPNVALAHDPLDLLPVDHLPHPPKGGVHARDAVGTSRAGVDLADPVCQLVFGALPFGDGGLRREPGVVGGTAYAQRAAQQRDAVAIRVVLGGLLHIDEAAYSAYFTISSRRRPRLLPGSHSPS